MPLVRCGFLLMFFGCLLGRGAGGAPFISEVYYHPAGTNLLEQWIELHNATPVAVDLGGWELGKAVRFRFPNGTMMAPGGYLVVGGDQRVFEALHPGAVSPVGSWEGRLGLEGDEVVLSDPAGNIVDALAYSTQGDWAERRLGSPDRLKRQGWEWVAGHHGGGKSLELVNSALPRNCGQNWASSVPEGGTPGRDNSVAQTNGGPLILEVTHFPLVPRSVDPVAVTARLADEETTLPAATVYWRLDGTAGFDEAPMADDGQHGDGLANDGVFGVILPAQTDRTLIEFYLVARDVQGHLRTYPNVAPSGSERTANLLYQVDDALAVGDQPIYRLLLSRAEHQYLADQIWGGEPNSDAEVSGTFLSWEPGGAGGFPVEVRHQCGFRNRGHGTRTTVPHNFHVAFPRDHPWKNRTGLNLNTYYTASQQLGSALFRYAGLPMAESRPVRVRVNGEDLAKAGQPQFGSYAANEVVDGSLARRQFPLDPDGNLYRGVRDMVPGISALADLAWHGPDYTAYTNAYAKENHGDVADWSDLLRLIDVLNHAPEETYATDVARVADVDQWMKYFAVNTLVDNQENSLGNGTGDDFGLYRGTRDTRFVLLPYDMDSVLGRGVTEQTSGSGLWRMTNVVVINRLIKHPEFAPAYYRHLVELARTAFAPERLDSLLDHALAGYVDRTALGRFKAFHRGHTAHVLSLIPTTVTIRHALPVTNGYPRTAAATVELAGSANAVETRRVVVNGRPVVWSAWEASWTAPEVALRPGLNRILVQAFDREDTEVGRAVLELWRDTGAGRTVGGSLATDETWTAASGPYLVKTSLTIASGATLRIEPGTTVYFEAGAALVVTSGGRLVAEGDPGALIRFGRAPGRTSSWEGIVINGAAGSPETRIAYAVIEHHGTTAIHSSGGTVFLDHLDFGTTDHPYLSLDASSFLVSDCRFPSPSAAFEPVHGSGGIKAGGRGVFVRNFFGTPTGYNDVVDFTGGNRPGGPIVHFLDNVFAGASDDALDLDGTDAWVEGNLFLHVHKNGTPDSASAVSGGSDGGRTSEVTILGNLFFDCDQALTAKQGNYYVFVQNTVVHQTRKGGLDTEAAVFNLADDGTSEGAGLYIEGNLVVDAEQWLRNHTAATLVVTNNLTPFAALGSDAGNSTADPMLVHLPALEETKFESWAEAQVLRRWLAPGPGSPAWRAGPNRQDVGGVRPLGVSVSGEPDGVTARTDATLTVGVGVGVAALPADGFPQGAGYTHYRYRLDGGPWSAESPIATPVRLLGLSDGPHRVEVSGRRDSGLYQDDTGFGVGAATTTSREWTVDRTHVAPEDLGVRIHEVVANGGPGTSGDFVELHNSGPVAVDLSGYGLTDRGMNPPRYTLPSGTILAPGAYLVIRTGVVGTGPGLSTAFGLRGSGDSLYLFDRSGTGDPVDSVAFGLQTEGHSIGRRSDGSWGLGVPTPGAANQSVGTGDVAGLRINEWLTDARFSGSDDFVELFNSGPHAVDLAGLQLTDAVGAVNRHVFGPLSFIAAGGHVRLVADGNPGSGGDHLPFRLSSDAGVIRLSANDGGFIDGVAYGAQRTDVSEGRTPSGGSSLAAFLLPTPGAANPGVREGSNQVATVTVPLVSLDAVWRYQQSGNLDGIDWTSAAYPDAGWPAGKGLLGFEDASLPAPGLQTSLTPGRLTYYFRTAFVVRTNLDGFVLNLTTVLDDGVVLYLNGTRMFTNGMSTASPHYSTLASHNVGNAAKEFFVLPVAGIVPGTNVLAAEVHQIAAASTDLVWGMALDATRSVTNATTGTALPVLLNEIAAAETPASAAPFASGDYLELFNPSATAVDLSGASLTDDPMFARKWVFPAGTTLPPLGHQVVWCDSGATASGTNTGFGLASTGGGAYLFARPEDGGGLLDGLRYGLQAAGYSVGRGPDGSGAWALTLRTPGEANVAAGLGSVARLRLNEWMADPAGGDDWFEVHNPDGLPVALGGLFLTDALDDPLQSPIPPLSFIGVGGRGFVRFHADANPGAGADHVGFSLRKSGEALGIFGAAGAAIDAIAFGSQAKGVSEGRFPDGAETRVAFVTTPSPGDGNFLPLETPRINEVLAHTDPPLEDAIELFNSSASAVDIGGWYLGNSRTDPRRYRIPDGTVIPGHGFKVFYEADFGGTNATSFTLNSAHGDAVVLTAADALGNPTGYRTEVRFGASLNGVSMGWVPTGTGADFVALQDRSFGHDQPATVTEFRAGQGLPNTGPRIGPVVISEVLYRWLVEGTEDPDAEFVELRNPNPLAVQLFDPDAPTNRWRLQDAVEFEFPTGTALPPRGTLLVVGFDPADAARAGVFRGRFSVPTDVPLFGPWSGRLGNGGNRVELVRPDAVQLPPHPDAGFVPRVLVEAVAYLPEAPWPEAAADGAHSLQRIELAAFGNDAANWRAATPTAGRPNNDAEVDRDRDGLPDAWELQHFGTLERDGTGDFDQDGMSDAGEFTAGTNPTVAADALRLSASLSDSLVVLQFGGAAGRSYSVQFWDPSAAPLWRRLADVAPLAVSGTVSVPDPAGRGLDARFYRVVTPAQP